MSAAPLRTVRRLLVAIDASDASRAALDAASTLLARGGGVIEALFVEDDRLLRLASLSCARALAGPNAFAIPLDPVQMGRELRILAEQARRCTEEVARRSRATIRFRATRGRVDTEIVAAGKDVDLIVLGRRTRRSGLQTLGTTACAVAAAGLAVLLLDERERLQAPVVVAVDGTPTSVPAIEIALALAARLGRPIDARRLRVVLVPDRDGSTYAARHHLEAVLGASPIAQAAVDVVGAVGRIEVECLGLRRAEPSHLALAVAAHNGQTTVLPLSLTSTAPLEAWVSALRGPVVVVGAVAPAPFTA